MSTRAFVLVQGVPVHYPQVIGVILERNGKLGVRFAPGVDAKRLLEPLNLLHWNLSRLSGERIASPGGACTYWEIPVVGSEDLDALWTKWSGPSKFF